MIQGKNGPVSVVIVAGMAKDSRVIGKNNELLWHVPADLKRFKKLSLGHPVIMGRKTFESILQILGKPLPGRTNIVVTRNQDYAYPGVQTATSLDEAFALAIAEDPSEIHIGGGAEMYAATLPVVDRLHLTFFYDDKEGDTFFPAFEESFAVTHTYPIEEHDGVQFQWIDWERKAS